MRGRPRDDASGFAWNGNKVPTFATPPRLTLMRALPSYWFFEVFFESFLLCVSLNIHFRLLLMSFSFLQSFLFAYFCFVLPILFCLTVYCEKQRHNVDDTLSCDENRCRRDEIALKLHEIRNIWNLFPLRNSFFSFFGFCFDYEYQIAERNFFCFIHFFSVKELLVVGVDVIELFRHIPSLSRASSSFWLVAVAFNRYLQSSREDHWLFLDFKKLQSFLLSHCHKMLDGELKLWMRKLSCCFFLFIWSQK